MAAYVQSGSQSHTEEVAARIEAGMVYPNGAFEDPEGPLGDYKMSGNGREWGEIPFGEFLETKRCDSRGLMSAEINLNQLERI
jgi:aldehyde dehydrogenase (NAD+)